MAHALFSLVVCCALPAVGTGARPTPTGAQPEPSSALLAIEVHADNHMKEVRTSDAEEKTLVAQKQENMYIWIHFFSTSLKPEMLGLDVVASDTIFDVKEKIQQTLSLEPKRQTLSLELSLELADERTLSSYHIVEWSTLKLVHAGRFMTEVRQSPAEDETPVAQNQESMKILVEYDGEKQLVLIVVASDTILNVKEKFQKQFKDRSPDRQKLSLKLADECQISSSNIVENSLLDLVIT